jgi:hypothetical protein
MAPRHRLAIELSGQKDLAGRCYKRALQYSKYIAGIKELPRSGLVQAPICRANCYAESAARTIDFPRPFVSYDSA